MSHEMTWRAMAQKGLKPATKIVLYWLAEHCNSETKACFPSLKTLEAKCEMNKTAIIRHLKILEEYGLIQRIKRQRANGSQTSTEYLLALDTVTKCDGEKMQKAGNTCCETIQAPVAKCNDACCETIQAPVAKQHPHNPVNINPVNEPIIENAKSHFLDENEFDIFSEKADQPQKVDKFDEFWSVVPKKVGKGQAIKAWRSAIKKASPELIIDGMKRYSKTREGKDHQYTVHPSTWLNGERWLDEEANSQSSFYDQIQQRIKDASNELSTENFIGNANHNRLSAPISETATPRRSNGDAGNSIDSRGSEQSYQQFIRPKRIPTEN